MLRSMISMRALDCSNRRHAYTSRREYAWRKTWAVSAIRLPSSPAGRGGWGGGAGVALAASARGARDAPLADTRAKVPAAQLTGVVADVAREEAAAEAV